MIGVSIEKLVVVLIVATLILGPTRLPAYAERVGAWARGLRAFVDAARARAEQDLGVPVRADDWQREVQRYDPRRIVREALAEPSVAPEASVAHPMPEDVTADGAPIATVDESKDAAPVAIRTRWIVAGGSSGHPRRIRVVEPIEADEPVEPLEAGSESADGVDARSASDRAVDASAA